MIKTLLSLKKTIYQRKIVRLEIDLKIDDCYLNQEASNIKLKII